MNRRPPPPPPPPPSPAAAAGSGLFQSLRRLLATGLAMAQVRLDLLGNELEQEKLRVFDALAWAAVALLLLGLGLLLGAALLVALAPEAWRPLVLGLLTLGCLGGGAWMLNQARQRLTSPGGVLAATRAELARDRDALADLDEPPPSEPRAAATPVAPRAGPAPTQPPAKAPAQAPAAPPARPPA